MEFIYFPIELEIKGKERLSELLYCPSAQSYWSLIIWNRNDHSSMFLIHCKNYLSGSKSCTVHTENAPGRDPVQNQEADRWNIPFLILINAINSCQEPVIKMTRSLVFSLSLIVYSSLMGVM